MSLGRFIQGLGQKVLSALYSLPSTKVGMLERQENGYTYREDTDENRVMFIFPSKPDAVILEQICQVMRTHVFRWSRNRTAWVRKLNAAGIWSAAEQVTQKLENIV